MGIGVLLREDETKCGGGVCMCVGVSGKTAIVKILWLWNGANKNA